MNNLNYLFAQYQKPLLRLANNRFGRKFLDLQTKEKIVGIIPNAIAFRKGNKFEGHFYCGKDAFAEKLGLALTALDILEFKELRVLMHYCGLIKNDFAYPLLLYSTKNIDSSIGTGSINAIDGSWNTAHDATTGTVDVNDASFLVQVLAGSDIYYIWRGFFPTDTSSLGVGAIVSACILKGYLTVTIYDLATYHEVALVGSTDQASFTTLAAADFNNCGAVDNPTKWSANIDISGLSTSAYNDFTFNAAGIAGISLTSYTPVGMREIYDSGDTDPGYAVPTASNSITVTGSGAGSNKPYLAITYTPAPSGGAFLLNFM